MKSVSVCASINQLFSPEMLGNSSCASDEHETELHAWIAKQPQSFADNQHTMSHAQPRLVKDIYDAVAYCEENVANGAIHSIYDDYEKNLDGCYSNFGFTYDMIQAYEYESEHDGPITSAMLSSRKPEESVFTIQDSLDPGQVGDMPLTYNE